MIMMIRGQKNYKDSSLQEVGKLLIVVMPNFKKLYRVVVAEHCTREELGTFEFLYKISQ